jgi:hypothetical protein
VEACHARCEISFEHKVTKATKGRGAEDQKQLPTRARGATVRTVSATAGPCGFRRRALKTASASPNLSLPSLPSLPSVPI